MRRLQPLINWARGNGLFFALLLLIAVFSAMSERFLTVSNFKVILQQVSVTGLIAVPGAMLVLANYVDLSVGSVSVLAAVVFGALMTLHAGLAVSIVLGLAAGVAWGAFNGYVIAVLGFSPIIVTLGGLAGARGIAELMTQGFTTFGYGPAFALLGNGSILSVPVPVWVFALIFAVGLHSLVSHADRPAHGGDRRRARRRPLARHPHREHSFLALCLLRPRLGGGRADRRLAA